MDAESGPSRKSASILHDERFLPKRFLVVSNRLPYQLDRDGDAVRFKRGVSGLVTALDPILRRSGGTWIGWPGSYEPMPERVPMEDSTSSRPYHLSPVNLSRQEVEEYYLGYANKSLWPLFHYFQEYCQFEPAHWKTYCTVNRRFADAVVREYREGDLVWIHDYHLMLLPALVRERLPDARIAYFHHIPFPSDEIYLVEPHARELLEGLLGADLVGFHLDSYVRVFLDSVARLTPHRFERSGMCITAGGRPVHVGSYPVSIDFEAMSRLAAGDAIPGRVAEIRDSYRAEIIALGVDRLDYTKGILERLQAIEIMLDRFEDLQGKFTFVQVSAPSRTKVSIYRELREKIEQKVGRINGRFGGRGCIPIDYRYEAYSREELAAMYRAADLALVTPLRDGMNLVSKEYVASRVDDTGALVLSRFAGAHRELEDATQVNPYDPETMAERIYETLMLPDDVKQCRMHRMRDVVRRNDIYWWLERFLRDVP